MIHSATSCTALISIYTTLHACMPTRFAVSGFTMVPAIGNSMRDASAVVGLTCHFSTNQVEIRAYAGEYGWWQGDEGSREYT